MQNKQCNFTLSRCVLFWSPRTLSRFRTFLHQRQNWSKCNWGGNLPKQVPKTVWDHFLWNTGLPVSAFEPESQSTDSVVGKQSTPHCSTVRNLTLAAAVNTPSSLFVATSRLVQISRKKAVQIGWTSSWSNCSPHRRTRLLQCTKRMHTWKKSSVATSLRVVTLLVVDNECFQPVRFWIKHTACNNPRFPGRQGFVEFSRTQGHPSQIERRQGLHSTVISEGFCNPQGLVEKQCQTCFHLIQSRQSVVVCWQGHEKRKWNKPQADSEKRQNLKEKKRNFWQGTQTTTASRRCHYHVFSFSFFVFLPRGKDATQMKSTRMPSNDWSRSSLKQTEIVPNCCTAQGISSLKECLTVFNQRTHQQKQWTWVMTTQWKGMSAELRNRVHLSITRTESMRTTCLQRVVLPHRSQWLPERQEMREIQFDWRLDEHECFWNRTLTNIMYLMMRCVITVYSSTISAK